MQKNRKNRLHVCFFLCRTMAAAPSQRDARAKAKQLESAEHDAACLRQALRAATAGAAAESERCAALAADLAAARAETLALRAAAAGLAASQEHCAAQSAELASLRDERLLLQARVASLLRQLHQLRPQRVHAACSPFPQAARAQAGTSPMPAPSHMAALEAAPGTAPALWVRTARASSPLRCAALLPDAVLTSLPSASQLTARELWNRWLALGEPVQYDVRLYTADSRDAFQRYRSFAKVVAQLLSLSAGGVDPIDILDSFLQGRTVYVCVCACVYC